MDPGLRHTIKLMPVPFSCSPLPRVGLSADGGSAAVVVAEGYQLDQWRLGLARRGRLGLADTRLAPGNQRQPFPSKTHRSELPFVNVISG